MATKEWVGGTSAVAQISTITLNNDTDDNETAYTITMTDENGGTSAVSITPSGVDESVIAAALQAAAAGSTNRLFTAITWTVATTVITATANDDGVPFYFASTVTGGTGTTTDATGTASAGPNDWNTAANWSTSGVPSSADAVIFTGADTSYDVLYGLDQSAIDLDTLKSGPSYTGMVGDPDNGFYLMIDVSNTTGKTVINSRGRAFWIEGLLDTISVTGGIRSADMVKIGPNTTTERLTVTGNAILGTITVANATTLQKLFMINCPRATVTFGTSVATTDEVVINSGTFNSESSIEATTVAGGEVTEPGHIIISGGTWNQSGAGAVRNIIQTGGTTNYNGIGTIGDAGDGDAYGLKMYGGAFNLTASEAKALTVVDAEVFGGVFTERSGTGVVTYTNDIIVQGGDVKVDTAGTIAVTR